MKIIIIEDEGITRQWLKKKLEELSEDNHVEGVFSNGRKALDYLECEKDVDVVFTDIRMPVMDGLEFLEKLLEKAIDPYKVILSAYDEFQYARQAIRLGAQEFVLKPEITKEALKQILSDASKYLEQRKQKKEEKKEESGKGKGAALAELIDKDQVSIKDLAAVFGEKVTEQEVRQMVIVDIYMEKQAACEDVEELIYLFLEQEQLQGIYFWSGNQRIILGYLHSAEAKRLRLIGRLGDILHVHTGIRLYLGISRMQGDGNVKEMYRQAVAARENRVFFGIPGAWQYDDMRISKEQEPGELYFNQDIKEIMGYLQQENYDTAEQIVDLFLDNVKKASYLHPAYVKALCDEIVSAYRHNLWECVLEDEEKERTKGTGFLINKLACEAKQNLTGRKTPDLEQLIVMVKGEVEALCGLLQKKQGNGQYSAPVKEVMRYVEEHLGERISLEQVADAVFLSRPYLSTLFKKETGKKFSSYLQEVRLEKSCIMLRNSRLSIGEIAEQAGFFDSAHFSKVFKEHYGCSPLEYRKTR